MSRTRVLYEHPLAYAASPVSITYKGRLGEHDLVYFANLFPGNRGLFQIDLESGGVRQLRELSSTGRHVWSGLAVEDDLFMAACDSAGTSPGVYRLRVDHAAATFEVEEQLSDSFEGIPLHGPNDVAFGKSGTIFFTDPGAFFGPPEGDLNHAPHPSHRAMLAPGQWSQPFGVYALDMRLCPHGCGNLRIARLDTFAHAPSGVAVDANERTLYVTLPHPKEVHAYDIRWPPPPEPPELVNHRVILSGSLGAAGGLAVDAAVRGTAGKLLVAHDEPWLVSYDLARGERLPNLHGLLEPSLERDLGRLMWLPNTGITGALPSANSRLILTLGAPPSKGYGNGGVVVVCQAADDDLCAGPGYEHHAYTALRVAAAAAALAAVVCAALCLRCCWRRLFRRRREKRD